MTASEDPMAKLQALQEPYSSEHHDSPETVAHARSVIAKLERKSTGRKAKEFVTRVSGPMLSHFAWMKRVPSAVLLGIQVVLIIAYPYLRQEALGRVFLAVTTVLMIGVVMVVVKKTPALSWVSWLFGVPSVVTAVLEAFWTAEPVLLGLTAIFHICFYSYAAYALIKYIFADQIVTVDEWYATAAAFTVVLWAFAYVFLLVEVLVPGSFTVFQQGDNSFFYALFLSFTVLTSVGLSDVMPITDQARSVVMIGEVIGVFYMALIVSRLVAMSSHRNRRNLGVLAHTELKYEEIPEQDQEASK